MGLLNGAGYRQASTSPGDEIETISSNLEVIEGDDDEGDVENGADDTESYIQPEIANQLSLARTYFLCITLGIFGAHYYYLGRRVDGLLFSSSLGFFGIGWIVDWFRIPSLVDDVRRQRREEAENGYTLQAVPYGELHERSLVTAYLYCIPPWGLLGIHHMYLGTFRKNDVFQLLYTASLGILGFGWLFDLFRMPMLVRRANEDIRNLRCGKQVSSLAPNTIHLDTAYMLSFPLGFFGLHHFYMRRYFYGIIYMLTLGIAGIGLLVDLIRLPIVFKRNKSELRDLKFSLYHVDDAYVLWFPLGIFGLHRFYLRDWKVGVLYLLTFGLLGVGWLLDAFRMRSLVERSNQKLDADLLWDHDIIKEKRHNKNANIFVHSKLYNYPIVDEDGNIHVYAFPLRPNGKPSWLLGWNWSPSATNQGGDFFDYEPPEERHKTPLVEQSSNGGLSRAIIGTDENYEVTIA